MHAIKAAVVEIQTVAQSLFGYSSGLRKWRSCTSQQSDATERQHCVCQKHSALFFPPILSLPPLSPLVVSLEVSLKVGWDTNAVTYLM